jgi:PAS domain S-box-containing protein
LLVAVLSGAAALIGRLLQPLVEPHFGVLLLPAVAISAWAGGFAPGIAAVLLTMAGYMYLLVGVDPSRAHGLEALGGPLAAYGASGLLINWAVAGQRAARMKLQSAYERSVETLGEAFFVLDSEWRFTYLNQESSNLFATPVESLLGKVIWQCLPELAGQPLGEELKRAASRGSPSHCENRLADTQTWYEIHAYPSSDGLVVHGRDVTDRKNAALERGALSEQLEHERALFRAVVDNIPSGVVLAEAPSGRIIMVNRQLEKFLRHSFPSSPNIASYPQWEAYHPDGRMLESHEYPLARALQGEAVQGEELLYCHGAGTREWMRVGAAPIRSRQGGITGAVVTFDDVDAEKRAALALQESELRYRLVARATNEAIWDWDVPRNVITWSGAIHTVFGCSQEELGTDAAWWGQRLHPEDRETVSTAVAAALDGSAENWCREYRFRKADDTYAVVLDRGFVVRDEQGRARRMIGSMLDVTARRQAEQEIRNLNQDLEARVERRTAELAAANKELEAFTYSVSHDLRAPLRQIDGFTRILGEELGPRLEPEHRSYFQFIQDGTRQMGDLVDDLLRLARVGRQAVRWEPAGLNSVVNAALQNLQADVAGREIEWEIGQLPLVECDPVLLRQVFQNLLGNAIKFTGPRERAVIRVGYIGEDGQRVFFVKDNGVGFNMKYAGKLFGVFQRLHCVEDFPGTGVGLAIVQRIIHKHGGRVWAEAELERGSTFYFTLGSGDDHERTARSGNSAD